MHTPPTQCWKNTRDELEINRDQDHTADRQSSLCSYKRNPESAQIFDVNELLLRLSGHGIALWGQGQVFSIHIQDTHAPRSFRSCCAPPPRWDKLYSWNQSLRPACRSVSGRRRRGVRLARRSDRPRRPCTAGPNRTGRRAVFADVRFVPFHCTGSVGPAYNS